jgi:uncharacterized protein YxjI
VVVLILKASRDRALLVDLACGTAHPIWAMIGCAAVEYRREEKLMGILRRHHGLGGTRYTMREKLLAIGEDFWVETDEGRAAFKVDGKAFRARDTFFLTDASGQKLYKGQQKKLHIHDTMELERDGEKVATIKKALITPLHERFAIELEGGGELKAKGNILDHEYKVERDGNTIAEVSRRWVRVRETYGIEVAPGEDDALILAATVCIDEMARD